MATNVDDAVRMARLNVDPLSVDAVLAAVADPGCGGVGLFVGTVRDVDPASTPEGSGSDRVIGLHYTSHPSAQEALAQVARSVAARHQVRFVAVDHRVGDLGVGDLAVVVAASAVHRAPALEACRDLIDTLKEHVPIWKEQDWASGNSNWSGVQ